DAAARTLRAEAGRARLHGPDRAFAQQLAYGAVQRRLTIDHVIAALSDRPLVEIDPPVLDIIRLGVFQILWMRSVPDHAAVAETVELAKGAGGGAAGFVNAVMRRAAREGPELLAALGDATPEEAALRHSHPEGPRRASWAVRAPAGFVNAVMRRAAREGPELLAALGDATPEEASLRHSHPEWLVRMWWDVLGRAETLALLERDNLPAEDALRVNTLTTSVEEVSS